VEALNTPTIRRPIPSCRHQLSPVALSRWLLQSRDLVQSDTLPLTQEFLSQMLGVQRSSVTLVARKLQEAGLIRYRRGHIHVLDVEGLQESCRDCYAAINAHFLKITGWSRPISGVSKSVAELARLFSGYVGF
jgi:DNA-binding transcriptional MocR family regulator